MCGAVGRAREARCMSRTVLIHYHTTPTIGIRSVLVEQSGRNSNPCDSSSLCKLYPYESVRQCSLFLVSSPCVLYVRTHALRCNDARPAAALAGLKHCLLERILLLGWLMSLLYAPNNTTPSIRVPVYQRRKTRIASPLASHIAQKHTTRTGTGKVYVSSLESASSSS